MAGGKRARGYDGTREDREWFICQNAVALVRDKERKIAKLRKRITVLEKAWRAKKERNEALLELTNRLLGYLTDEELKEVQT